MATTAKQLEREAAVTWEVAFLYPAPGQWTEGDYLALSTNRHVELSAGVLEVPEMPTRRHQAIVFLLCWRLRTFVVARNLGKTFLAPLPVRLWEGKMREPDVFFVERRHQDRVGERFCGVPDLVMEVISPGTRRLDEVTKAREYARAGVSEYWIVDPERETITVLTRTGSGWRRRRPASRGATARSVLLRGFALPVDEVMAAD
jgi:Uma2 family endonuclease